MDHPIIETREVTMMFGGHRAVDRVSLEIRPRTLTSIIGPNGAGKTTFFNLLSGQLKPTAGRVFYRGKDVTGLPPHYRTRMGMGRSFQITNVFPRLAVLENVRLAAQAQAGVHYNLFRHYRDYLEFEERAMGLLEVVGLGEKAAQPAANLAHGEKRKLELAILLALETEVLLLDEPTAGMAVEEVPAILDLLARVKTAGDKTILLVEHKMDMVLSLSDEIAVLFNGRLLAKGPPEDIMQNQQVQSAYLGGMA